MPRRGLALGAALLALAACKGEAPAPETRATEVPEEFRNAPPRQVAGAAEAGEATGTPMEERVATIGLVNKRNNLSRDFEMKPGDSVRYGDVIIRLSACEKPAPWEDGGMTGAFVQVFVNERPDVDSERTWNRIFSGWMFKESPSLNVVEHPVYDVWVKDCAMSFPDEEAPAEDASEDSETTEA